MQLKLINKGYIVSGKFFSGCGIKLMLWPNVSYLILLQFRVLSSFAESASGIRVLSSFAESASGIGVLSSFAESAYGIRISVPRFIPTRLSVV
jgi:hypothetical protein